MALCGKCWKDAGDKCVVCKTNPAQNARVFQHCCRTCFGGKSEAILAELVREESDSYLKFSRQPQTWTGKEPALSVLLQPDATCAELPPYASTPEYLSPDHCRLCFKHVRAEDLAEHLRDEHADCPDLHREGFDIETNYRRAILNASAVAWPTPISPQILRARVAEYEAKETDDNFALAACAVCARQKHRCKLLRAVVPHPDADACPEWLHKVNPEWSDEFWGEHKGIWYDQLTAIFSNTRYMEDFFETSSRIENARSIVEKLRKGASSEQGFESVEAAEAWLARVRAWKEKLAADLHSDTVVAPGDGEARWLLYRGGFVTDDIAVCDNGLVLQVCNNCAGALGEVRRDGANVRPVARVPRAALVNGMWRGPDPPELARLTYAECKVINLAKIYVSVKRIFLDKRSFAPSASCEAPMYHQRNVVAYPQSPDKALAAVGMLPSALALTILVQFVGENDDALRRHPDIQVCVDRLRAAFRWLSTNNWAFMDATRHHVLWDTGLLDASLEELLAAYRESIGGNEGVPQEILASATPASAAKAAVSAEGPADCAEEVAAPAAPQFFEDGENAAVVNGGLEDEPSVRLWAQVCQNVKVADALDKENRRLRNRGDASDRTDKKIKFNEALESAVKGIQRLSDGKVREKLEEWSQRESTDRPSVQIVHGSSFLSSRTPNFWSSCFVRLFPRGDCQETCAKRRTKLPSQKWAKTLVNRADTACWSRDVEFVATLFNTFLRREQMGKVEAHVHGRGPGGASGLSPEDAEKLSKLTASSLISAAAASKDADSIRDLLRQHGLDNTVQTAARHMHLVLRRVRGSAEERDGFITKFRALRIWSGCSSLFFTLNPHDIRSPLTVLFAGESFEVTKKFSLSMTEAEATQWMAEFDREDPRRLHRYVAQNPLTATKVFHHTVRLVIRTLFNCTDSPEALRADGIAANDTPGIFGHVRAFLGVVEEQMRKALHIHMLVQILGFAHPEDIFRDDMLPTVFRRLYWYQASVLFRSTEAFANYTNTSAGPEKLRQQPLMVLTKGQRVKVGGARVQQSNAAQMRGRGMSEPPSCNDKVLSFPFYPSRVSGDPDISGEAWAARCVEEIFSRTRKTGNHVCKPSVCHKGRLGNTGFCRMYYWHWSRFVAEDTGRETARRLHGLQLHDRWDGNWPPPTMRHPPNVGLPALETTHPFHFRCCPAALLGPQCNHDVACLIRVPEMPDEEGCRPSDAKIAETKASMAREMGNSEYYVSSYSSKAQPHADGLVLTMAHSVQTMERFVKEAEEGSAEADVREKARKMLHRLVSASNNRMHKGFPEMLSYIIGKPILYHSHPFVPVYVANVMAAVNDALVRVAHGKEAQGQCAAPAPYSVKLSRKPFLCEFDYVYRPTELKDFPIYFFFAACDAKRPDRGRPPLETLPWHEFPDGPRPRQATHQPKMSSQSRFEDASVPLRGPRTKDEPLGPILYVYDYYVHLRVDQPWKVPEVFGKLPRRSDDVGTDEFYEYAKFISVLFRPFRKVADIAMRVLQGRETWRGGPAEFKKAFVSEFVEWERSVAKTAALYHAHCDPVGDIWWAERIRQAVRNYDFAADKPGPGSGAAPTGSALADLPPWQPAADSISAHPEPCEGILMESESDVDLQREVCEDHEDESAKTTKRNIGRSEDTRKLHCGTYPDGDDLQDIMMPKRVRVGRSAEDKYVVDFWDTDRDVKPIGLPCVPGISSSDGAALDPEGSRKALEQHCGYVKLIDSFSLDPARCIPRGRRDKADAVQKQLTFAVGNLPTVPPRTTSAVVDAALFLMSEGICGVPELGSEAVNAKQGRAILWAAVWLQDVMNREWNLNPACESTAASRPESLADNFQLALMGAGGTGKTTVLRVIEALINYFRGPDSVRKCAPSNSAARLLNGDTLHAVCKLPFGTATIKSKKGRLSTTVREKYRQRWEPACACFIDEISMVSPDNLFQSEFRMKEAKVSERAWGGLGMVLSGDFMQLPPVDPGSVAPSLAQAPDELLALDDADDKGDDKKRAKITETIQGLMLWRRTRRVVSLDLNRRSPGRLSMLLAEMRELGRSRDTLSEVMWNVYKSRWMIPDDARTREEPFSNHPWQYIVHRHKIRVYRSLLNAQDFAASLKRTLYVVKASDVATELCNQGKMPSVQRYLDSLSNPRDTQDLPGVLPLYVGMRLTMHSKECVRFGLMKGCVCTLRHIVFSEHEDLPETSKMMHLKYLPVCLWLQAEDVEWRLPEDHLPSDLPHDTDRRGLFPLGPKEGYLQAKPDKNDKDSWFSVRRRTFRVVPSDTLIVYGAQGCSYDAIIADMQKPPHMDEFVHWLACYVMLSRPRTLEGLLVLRPATRLELERAPPAYLLKELDRLEGLENASFEELLERLSSMTLKYRTDVINQSVLHAEGPRLQLDAVEAARHYQGPRKRLRVKTPSDIPGAPAKKARAETQVAVPEHPGNVERPAKTARMDSPKSAPATETSSSAVPSASVRTSSEQEKGNGDKNTQAAIAAEARRQAERARGVGKDAASRLEQQGRARPSSSQCGSKLDTADLFGASRAASLRATLRASDRPTLRAARPVGDDAEASSATAACSSGLAQEMPSGTASAGSFAARSSIPGDALGGLQPEGFHLRAQQKRAGAPCESCGRTCHRDNSDPLCSYYGRARVDHTDAAMGDTVPHLSQTEIAVFVDDVRQANQQRGPGWYTGKRLRVVIDGKSFELGSASGDGCNCLIDTLRKLLNQQGNFLIPQGSVEAVRCSLEDKHRTGATPIICGDYLDLALYWEDVVTFLLEADHFGNSARRRQDSYEIVCADMLELGHGDRLPHYAEHSGRHTLFLARVNRNHFVPLRPCYDPRSLRPVPP